MGLAIAADDRAAVLRVARYGARAPVAVSRLRYEAERGEVELASDAHEGPYAGAHRFSALEFQARLLDHIPAKGEVWVRYYGEFASRRRGWWRRRGVVLACAASEGTPATEREAEPWPALAARLRRWAELLRHVFAVEVCPKCGGAMRVLVFVTEHSIITRMLAHLRRRGVDAARGGRLLERGQGRGRLPATRKEVPIRLAEIGLRGRTGASVIAISRVEEVVLVSDGHEMLKPGDGVALAGTSTAIDAARYLLAHGDEGPPLPVNA